MPYPMKIANLAGKGLGVLAAKALKPGHLILREHPIARVDKTPGSPESRANPTCTKLMNRVMEMAKSGQFDPRSDFPQWPSEIVSCFEGILDEQAKMAYEKLDGEKQTQWMELSDVHAKEEDHKSPGGILRTNAIDDAENHANLYRQLSRMNHCCAPNVVRVSTDNRGGVAVVASKGIGEGEEVLINYMDGADDGLPVEKRREHLMQQYHFHCTCDLCMKQDEKCR
mmetsp:Transcript_14365/g.26118  ORF Transcript_14365/g.26118 Transcript_14365/m.26118 type:complete len:226 (+) Transcript_14365:178-855(+)